MKRMIVLIAVAVLATLIGTSIAVAQEVTLEDVKAELGDLTSSGGSRGAEDLGAKSGELMSEVSLPAARS